MSQASSISLGFEVGVMYEECLYEAFLLAAFIAGFASGVSVPTSCSCQKDVAMSIKGSDACVLADGLVRVEEPDVRLRALSRELPRPRGAGVLALNWPFIVFCVMREEVPVTPSWPTVACLMSSKNVRSPSLMSVAICLPVLRITSRLVSFSDSSSHLSSLSPLIIAAMSGVVEERLSL